MHVPTAPPSQHPLPSLCSQRPGLGVGATLKDTPKLAGPRTTPPFDPAKCARGGGRGRKSPACACAKSCRVSPSPQSSTQVGKPSEPSFSCWKTAPVSMHLCQILLSRAIGLLLRTSLVQFSVSPPLLQVFPTLDGRILSDIIDPWISFIIACQREHLFPFTFPSGFPNPRASSFPKLPAPIQIPTRLPYRFPIRQRVPL